MYSLSKFGYRPVRGTVTGVVVRVTHHAIFRSFVVIKSCFENGATDPHLPIQL